MIRKSTLIVVILLMGVCGILAQENATYRNTLEKMFEVSGSKNTYQASLDQMLTIYREQFEIVDAKIWDELEKALKNVSMSELIDRLVPVCH